MNEVEMLLLIVGFLLVFALGALWGDAWDERQARQDARRRHARPKWRHVR